MFHTFFPFFSKFGNFNKIQLKTIPHILKGENVVLISGTGSGKTRAIIAPVVERLLTVDDQDDVFLYICPTRALVNDTFKRLQSPMDSLGLKIIRKTGDYPYNKKKNEKGNRNNCNN